MFDFARFALLFVTLAFAPSATAQAHPPHTFVIAAAEHAIQGDPQGVLRFVTWSDTPQGHGYWSAEHGRAEASGRLSAGAAAILVEWVTQARAGLASRPPSSFVRGAAQRVLNGDVDAIPRFVTWSDTPQGDAFWRRYYADAVENPGQLFYSDSLPRMIIQSWVDQSR